VNDSVGYFLASSRTPQGSIDTSYFCVTTDTFATWYIKKQISFPIRDFYALDEQVVYAFMDDSLRINNLMKSIDGGVTWVKIEGDFQALSKIHRYGLTPPKIYFNPAQVGFATGNKYLYMKEKETEHWILKKFNCPFYDVYFIGDNIGFAVGGSGGAHFSWGELWFTNDGGGNWSTAFRDNLVVFSCLFINNKVGFIIIGQNISKTIDLGKSWTVVFESDDSTDFESLKDLGFFKENKGWAVGRYSSGAGILGTTDGGESWEPVWKYPEAEIYDYSLNSIHTLNRTAWAVGESGMIVKYSEQDQWQLQPFITDLPLNRVFFRDEQHGWISGGYLNDQDFQSILLNTDNGGTKWSEIRFDKYLINDMFFEDSLHGWAVGSDTSDSGILIETQDGGDNWNVLFEDLSAPLNALHFKDGFGWAVGGNGLVLRTNDGVNWINQNTGETFPVNYSLSQNYPNPFNPSTTIKYNLPKPELVKIEVYNIAGQIIQTLLNKNMSAGSHEIEFNAQNLSSGIYYYRIEAGEFQDVKKMILLK
jgi:photosystem II stability/assembly factor-like uncharacterized protein